MSAQDISGQVYTCPMHKDVRQSGPGKCPACGMALQPEGVRFGMARYILSSPMHLMVMGAVMLAIIAAAMMWK